MFRDNRAELAYIHIERFTGTIEAEDQSALPVIRTSGLFARPVMRGVSKVCSREWIGGRDVHLRERGLNRGEGGGTRRAAGGSGGEGDKTCRCEAEGRGWILHRFLVKSDTSHDVLSQLVLSFIERLNTGI